MPPVTLLTDFGLNDHYVAAMKGVILSLAPAAVIVDITHLIPPFQIGEAAYELAQAWRYFPNGTVHVAVVDPGVGSARRAVLAEAGGHLFVGPDNGIFSLALQGLEPAYREITEERFFVHPVSSTFHGRDIFAPVGANLSLGTPAADFGSPIQDWVQLPRVFPVQVAENRWCGRILRVDRFGNVITSFPAGTFQWVAESPFELRHRETTATRFSRNYAAAAPGELFVLAGSGGYLEISSHAASAGVICGAKPGEDLFLTRL